MRSEHERGDFNPADDRLDRAMDRAGDELHAMPIAELIEVAMKHKTPGCDRESLQHAASDVTFEKLEAMPDSEFITAIQSHLTEELIRDKLMHAELTLAYLESKRD